MQRDVLVEAGHRCAIPTCRSVPVEIAHIVPWATVKEHTFDNLVALCPTCHTRYDKGEIDRQSMLRYKANLGLLTSRYGELERRVLEVLGRESPGQVIVLPGNLVIMVMYLLQDGLAEEVSMGGSVQIQGVEANRAYRLTPKGREFVDRWRGAEDL